MARFGAICAGNGSERSKTSELDLFTQQWLSLTTSLKPKSIGKVLTHAIVAKILLAINLQEIKLPKYMYH